MIGRNAKQVETPEPEDQKSLVAPGCKYTLRRTAVPAAEAEFGNPQNVEALGLPAWRTTKKMLSELGVAVYGERRRQFFVLADLRAALKRTGRIEPEPAAVEPVEDLDAVLARHGLRACPDERRASDQRRAGRRSSSRADPSCE